MPIGRALHPRVSNLSIFQQPARPFADILSAIVGMNAVQRIRRGNDPAAVLSLIRRDDEFYGEAARIRMDDLPSVIHTATGHRHDLDVDEREGLGEEIHFLYRSDLDVVAVQNKGHFRAPALERLVSDLTDTMIDFQVILTEDAWNRFQRMDLATRIEFKLARPRDFQGRAQPAVNRIFQEMDEFNGVAAKVEITVGRNRNRGLSMETIRALLQSFRQRDEMFQSLNIKGVIRDGEEADAPAHSTTIDFIKERLLYSEEVERGGRGRRLNSDGCRVALGRSIRLNEPHLRRHA